MGAEIQEISVVLLWVLGQLVLPLGDRSPAIYVKGGLEEMREEYGEDQIYWPYLAQAVGYSESWT